MSKEYVEACSSFSNFIALILSHSISIVSNFSESERKLNLFKYLGLFSRRDAIPDQYYEDPDDPESVLPENLENPK